MELMSTAENLPPFTGMALDSAPTGRKADD
jgi:hypothetical protein